MSNTANLTIVPGSPCAAGKSSAAVLAEVQGCTRCAGQLPFGPRPVLQWHPKARILIAGQAPGRAVHESGIPFADASGDRLRTWLGLTPEQFYDPRYVAILPMGFCFPGSGKSGDLPPRPECAAQWRGQLLLGLQQLQLTLVIGRYAQDWHLPGRSRSVTTAVEAWRDNWPTVIPLPHPSPRNNRWLRRNPWFETQLLPRLRVRVAEVLGDRRQR